MWKAFPPTTRVIAKFTVAGQQVSVPDVVGLSEANAVAAIQGAGLVAVVNQQSSETVAEGDVISQDPVAATMVDVGSDVTIVVSTGPQPQVSVPDVVGLSEANAVAAIGAAGLAAVVNQESSETVAEGDVISQDPVAATMVDVGSDVTIVVSTGPQPQQVSVPDVVGLSEANAVAAIGAAGLVAVVNQQSSETVAEGDVISQDPVAATMVDVGSDVTIVVSTGPIPETAVIFDPNDLTKAIGIDNLDVNGTTYDIAFTAEENANTVYGEFEDAEFDWARPVAADVGDAINVELGLAGAETVGAEEQEGQLSYNIGFATALFLNIEFLRSWFSDIDSTVWGRSIDEDGFAYDNDARVFAVLIPEPSSALLSVAALATLGLIRRLRREESEGTV